MRKILAVGLVAMGGMLAAAPARADYVPPFKGNDTGGIIPWSPGIDEVALELAGGHCMRYGKYAQITSVHPWPGDYIGFVCKRAGRWGPAYN